MMLCCCSRTASLFKEMSFMWEKWRDFILKWEKEFQFVFKGDKSTKIWFFFFFFFHNQKILSLVSFHRSKKKKRKKSQCSEWDNTLMHGSPVLETYWSWTIRYQAWALFREGRGASDRFAVLERCATQDNPNGCITNSTQDIRYRKEQQF